MDEEDEREGRQGAREGGGEGERERERERERPYKSQEMLHPPSPKKGEKKKK